MKWLTTILAVTLLRITVSAAPHPTATPFFDLVGISAEDIRRTEEHRDQLAKALQDELTAEKADHLKISMSLSDATDANLRLQRQVNTLQSNYDQARKSLFWYRMHWWGAWIMLGLGVAGCVLFGVLKLASKFP